MTATNHRNLITERHDRRTRWVAVRTCAAGERGAVFLEFVLVLPLVLALLFGVAEFGLAVNSQNDQTHLANEVARYAAVNEDPGGGESLQAWGKKGADTNFLKGSGTVCISFPNGTQIGNPVKVEVTSTVKWLPIFKLAATSVQSTAYMRLEALPTKYTAGCA